VKQSTQTILANIASELGQEGIESVKQKEQAYKSSKKQLNGFQVLSNMGIEVPGFQPDMKVVQEKARIQESNYLEKLQTNANEAMHTTNTGYGEELVPSDVLMNEVLEALPTYQRFVQALPGFHGAGLDTQVTRSIIGDAGLMHYNPTEHTTGALDREQATHRLGTDKVTLNQKQMFMLIDVSDQLATFNQLGAAAFETLVRNHIAMSWARTVEAVIINGDTETGATGNINRDDAAPASGHVSYDTYLGWNGLRKMAIVTDANTVNVSALTWADFIAALNKIDDYAAMPDDCMWLFNRQTYNQALTLDEFKKANENGQKSVIFDGALTNILGSDLFVNRDLPKTEADGKVSDTAGNNTLGQFLYFWKPAVQWGYGKGLTVKLYDYGHKGYQLDGWGYMGLAIVGSGQTANLSKNTVTAGINVTLS